MPGAAEIALGDLRDRANLDAALTDVDAVFYIAPAFMAGEAAVGTGMVEATKLSLDTPTKSSSHVSDDTQVAAMRAMFDWYDTHGLLGNALTLRAILGREPRTMRAYIQELAATPQAPD